ncbi:PadR family transcriptional regulator [Streptosporangium sp. NPDC050855]|uniref:PadR family transcriptional regulator n=1 Tax=Streptosporangium sp. NPDC050855 TaxID=3366194 RepID=UPI003797A00E
MNLTRLMILGLMAAQGPLHGHEIKRIAAYTDVSEWGGVGVGAINRELRQADEAGLIRQVAVEQVGRRPVRTVYEITGTGRRELAALREAAICELRFGPDALAVALLFGRAQDPAELAGLLARRREQLASTISDLEAERAQLVREGRIGTLDAALFRRQETLLQAEIRWLDEHAPAITTGGEER